MLIDVLNNLSAPGPARHRFSQAARELGSKERREAAVLHLSALLEALPEVMVGDRLDFDGVSASLAETDRGADIDYDDLGLGYRVDGARLARQDGPPTMAGLLELLVYARDRSDTVLFLPNEMRQERILELARRVGASERFVRFVLARAPAIERNIAA